MPDLTITIPSDVADRLAATFAAELEDLEAIILDNLDGERMPRLYLSDEDRTALEEVLAITAGENVPGAGGRARAAAVRLLRRVRRFQP